jgi:hypothetical protein
VVAEAINVMDWDEPDTGSEDRERFRVENDSQAVWAMRKLAAAKARLNDIALIAESEIARVQHWAEQQSREPMRNTEYFEGILVEYGMSQRAEGRKTVSTPYGAIKSRTGQPKYTFTDRDEFIAWAKANRPGWVAVKEEPALSVIRAETEGAVDSDTGEIIPGLSVDPASVSFSVEVEK